jgi:hypothetical protein
MTETQITPRQANLNNTTSLYQQALINGNLDVWQRGTSFSNPSNGDYMMDRFYLGLASTAWAATVSRQTFTVGQTDVPNNPKYFARFAITTSTTTYFALNQRIEGVEKFAGHQATISFWAKVDSGTHEITPLVKQKFGTGGSPSSDVNTAGDAQTVTTSWQKFTYTFDVPSISGKTLGTNGDDSLEARLTLENSWTGTLDIAQVQLNAGSTALPFQPKSFEEELRACQRYYERITSAGAGYSFSHGFIGSSNLAEAMWFFKVNKRDIPTTSSSSGNEFDVRSTSTPYAGTSTTFSNQSKESVLVTVAGASASNVPAKIRWKSVSNWIDADAEL